MNVHLTPKLESLVRQKVDNGLYTSASEVVREALRLLEERDYIRQMRFEELRQAIREGKDDLDAGRTVEWDKEAFLKKAHGHLEASNANP